MNYNLIIRRGILSVAFLLCFRLVLAQQPDWSVDPSQYTNTMVVVGVLNFDRTESVDVHDKIAAFIDGECRGVAEPMYIEQAGRYIAYLMVYSNESSGTISFKMYDADKEKVVSVVKEMNFVVDGLIGDAERPFVWSNVLLNSETEVLSFSFPQQVKQAVFEENNIWIELRPGTDITSLKPSYTLSSGAVAFAGEERQESGLTTLDFSEPVVYTVRSEDEQVFEDYTIHVFLKEEELPVTNFISPNGDGINDKWEVQNLHLYQGYRLKVFDRNGSMVYSSANYQNEWEGQNYRGDILPNGTYYYQFIGSSSAYKGTVEIYR